MLMKPTFQMREGIIYCFTSTQKQNTHEAKSRLQFSLAMASTRKPSRLSKSREVCTPPRAERTTESHCYSARRNPADEDPLTAGRIDVLEYIERVHLRSGGA